MSERRIVEVASMRTTVKHIYEWSCPDCGWLFHESSQPMWTPAAKIEHSCHR